MQSWSVQALCVESESGREDWSSPYRSFYCVTLITRIIYLVVHNALFHKGIPVMLTLNVEVTLNW